MKKACLFLLILACLCAACFSAPAETAAPGEIITATFTVLSNPGKANSVRFRPIYDTDAMKLLELEGGTGSIQTISDTSPFKTGRTFTADFWVNRTAKEAEYYIYLDVLDARNSVTGTVSGLVLSSFSFTVSKESAAAGSSSASRTGYSYPQNEVILTESFISSSSRNAAVYSGPGQRYYRSANGKAEYAKGQQLEVYGEENGWYLICYWFRGSERRMGYVLPSASAPIKNPNHFNTPQLNFAYENARISYSCELTDDPFKTFRTVSQIPKGKQVTYLATLPEGHSDVYRNWAYIEVSDVSAFPEGTAISVTRGFVPLECLEFFH